MVWSEKQVSILKRAIAEETRAQNMDVRFEFIDGKIQTVFPEGILNYILNLFYLDNEAQIKGLRLLHPRTVQILSELDFVEKN